MTNSRKHLFSLFALIAALYFIFRISIFFFQLYGDLHTIPYMDIPDAVTMDNKFHWNNLFTHHVLISKVTEISYSLAILFIALLFLSLSKAKITKTMAIKNLKFLGLSLSIGAGYKFFIWPFLDTMILHLDKVTIPILSNDPMFFLIGIGVYFGAVFAQKVNFELESFV